MAEADQSPQPAGFFARFLSEMSMTQRLLYLGAAALLVGGLVVTFLWVNQPNYQVLYSGLNSQDASSVVTKLKEMKVPYQLEGGGQIIKVPEEQVYDLRLALAGAGLPRGQGIGFEVFNEVKMGTTEFVQKINYQRALQGELARTISSFSEVEQARVHIVMPRESLFVEEEKKPSAGVVLRLAAGRGLSPSQVSGIVHLVASSVPDLTDDRVTIVDTRGNLIYRKSADSSDFAAGLTANQLDYRRSIENLTKGKAQSMLEEVLGQGRAVVRVSAEIDFTRTSSTEEIFDPDKVAVRSETRNSQTSKGTGGAPTGSPDQRFALAARNATPGQQQSGQETSGENETTNFEISRTRTQLLKAQGEVKRLSVAVVVDGPYKTTEGAEGQSIRTFNPRSPEEMRQLGDIVRRAVGYNESRGDEVTVVNMPFFLPEDTGMVGLPWWQEYLKQYGRTALNLILGLLFFFLVAKPLLRYLTARHAAVTAGLPAAEARRLAAPGEELPPGAEAEALLEEEARARRKPSLREQIKVLTEQDPQRATSVLRAWIQETD